jgi:hypothetical protein
LDENLLSAVPILQEAMEIVLGDYRALLASSEVEKGLMVRINHAKCISRIGFVAQDMKDLHVSVLDAIELRAWEINSNDTECISQAESNLEAAVKEAGEVIMSAANEWKASNAYLSSNILFRSVHEIQLVVSSFEIELLNLFANLNGVTNLQQLLVRYQTGLQVFFLLFEYYLYDVLDDFFVYDIIAKEKNQSMFIKLDESWRKLQADGKSIVDSLQSCN